MLVSRRTAALGPLILRTTIVAVHAAKALISSLASGLLTIGSRFGDALYRATALLSNARDIGLTPRELIDQSRKRTNSVRVSFILLFENIADGVLAEVSGVSHNIKGVNNPDLRVVPVKECIRKNFSLYAPLDHALAVGGRGQGRRCMGTSWMILPLIWWL